MAIDIKAIAAAAAAKTNMQEATKGGGGGDYTPPAAGTVRLRLVSYIELGKHRDEYQGQVKIKDKVQLVFELSGPNHQPREGENGEKYPQRITITESLSLNEKANFYKLFNKMRDGRQDVQHMSQMLGEEFLGKIVHKPGKKDPKKVYAQLRELSGEYTIRPPFMEVEDEETGEIKRKRVKVPEPLSPLRLFIWDLASKEMWDTLFIDGEYPEKELDDGTVLPAKTKNVIQAKLKEALNWDGSPIASILEGADEFGDDDDDDAAEEAPQPEVKKAKAAPKKPAKAAAADPLDGLDDDDDSIPF